MAVGAADEREMARHSPAEESARAPGRTSSSPCSDLPWMWATLRPLDPSEEALCGCGRREPRGQGRGSLSSSTGARPELAREVAAAWARRLAGVAHVRRPERDGRDAGARVCPRGGRGQARAPGCGDIYARRPVELLAEGGEGRQGPSCGCDRMQAARRPELAGPNAGTRAHRPGCGPSLPARWRRTKLADRRGCSRREPARICTAAAYRIRRVGFGSCHFSPTAILWFLCASGLGRTSFLEVSQDGTYSMEEGSNSNTIDTIDSRNSMDGKRLARMDTTLAAFKEYQLIVGRENEKSDIIKMISNGDTQEFEVISICGMGGIGETTLVKYIYENQKLYAKFEKRACITIKRPFNVNELLKSLSAQLGDKQDANGDKLTGLLEGKKYLIVLDDISSTTEWDAIVKCFPTSVTMSRIIVTTREENIAKHCSEKDKNIYKLNFLGDKDAHDLFTEKVFGSATYLDEQYAELAAEAKLILKKCNGLPLAIVTIGGFLAKQPKTLMEWRKLNEHISAELEINPELQMIPNVLILSYDGLPYHLKSCFLYLSIFPEDYNISRKRLVRRWIAEGYPSEVRGQSMIERADMYFMELIDRGMILPSQQSVWSRKRIDSCKVHDLMREISISKSTEENLVFRLEEGCSSNTHGAVRHLTISSNWEGDKRDYEGTVDLSRIRSLTVFGKWRSFFISNKMSLLRVLDLENTKDLQDHHLEQIGKLHHLKYLSLRGCTKIYYLPGSLGNLKQLQTLDIKHTNVWKLPKTIINLRKLQHIHAKVGDTDTLSFEGIASIFRVLLKAYVLTLISGYCCVLCCAPQHMDDGSNRRDVCTLVCCYLFPCIIREVELYGVELPRGFRKLRALHTLSVVNINVGKGILKEIKALTQLRRLAVTGIDKKNCKEFCSTLVDLRCLESLTVHSMREPGLQGCLDGVSSPPENLQSLKLRGNLVKLPEWIGGLNSLVKLKMKESKLSELDATIQVLGRLPNLAILCLLENSFKGEELSLTFHREAFPSLMVLQLYNVYNLKSVVFEEGTTHKLELLLFIHTLSDKTSVPGLSSLRSLKEVVIKGLYSEEMMENVRGQLARNPSKPVLKMDN